ncbi:MAG: hypothetical protein VW270_09200 [Candidatus Poseidoniales archaeon]|jgi:hypothetical protein
MQTNKKVIRKVVIKPPELTEDEKADIIVALWQEDYELMLRQVME